MLHELLLALVGLFLIFLLPGYLLTYAIFPRPGEMDREYDFLYRTGLGVVLGIAVVILLGFVLNAFPPSGGVGAVTGPNLWVGIVALDVTFLGIGWYRGAHPWLARIHPALRRPPPRDPQALLEEFDIDKDASARFRELAEQRDHVRREIRTVDKRLKATTGDVREHDRARRATLQGKLKGIDTEIRRLEEARARELY